MVAFWLMALCLYAFLKRRIPWQFAMAAMPLACLTAAGPYAWEGRPYAEQKWIRGMNLTEQGTWLYDAAKPGAPETPAQIAVDQIQKLGVNHIILNPRATMTNPKGMDVIPMTKTGARSAERERYKRLIDYIHSKGMTVGIRPIFFVVKPDGTFPYIDIDSQGHKKLWWHGKIQPKIQIVGSNRLRQATSTFTC